jgi:hypothetical protein
LAVAVAIHTGVAPDVWLANTRALATAVELIDEANRRARRR